MRVNRIEISIGTGQLELVRTETSWRAAFTPIMSPITSTDNTPGAALDGLIRALTDMAETTKVAATDLNDQLFGARPARAAGGS